MSDSLVPLSYIAAAGNWALFLAQTPLMLRILREWRAGDPRASAKYSWLPSIALLTTMSLWSAYTFYFVFGPARVPINVGNFMGIIVPLCYTAVFALCDDRLVARVRYVGGAVVSVAATWCVCIPFVYYDVPNGKSVIGGLCTFLNCGFFLSAFRQLYLVWIRRRELATVPRALSAVQVLQTTTWVVVASLLDPFDSFIFGVNLTGLCCALLQCVVILLVTLRDRRGVGVKVPIQKAMEGGETPVDVAVIVAPTDEEGVEPVKKGDSRKALVATTSGDKL